MYPDYVFLEKQGQPNLSIQSFEWNVVEFKKVIKCVRSILVSNTMIFEKKNFDFTILR